MRKANAIGKIREFGEYYTGVKKKADAIKADKTYSEEFKASQIDHIMAEYNAKSGKYKADMKSAVEAIQDWLTEKRQADLAKGLASAETVNNIINGIKGGVYTGEMMRDLLAIHRDNAYAVSALRSALVASENTEYQSIGIGIPLANDDRIAHNLDRIISGISEIPSPLATENGSGNWSTGFFQNGTTFDNWCSYIENNVEE